MGKLLIGHYGKAPEAESVTIALKDCNQRLGLKPSDFVSAEEPGFFRKAHGGRGKYLVFQVDKEEIQDAAVWRPGYYLLPLEAADVLKLFNRQEIARGGSSRRPTEHEWKDPPPPEVLERANRWAEQSQPLLFECHCPHLVLRLEAPSLIRRHWKARLTCRKRCQPPIKALI